MSEGIVGQVLYPMLHKAQLANAVTSFATCLGGIMPLLYCWLGKRQPGRWMFVYLCILITGIPTVWLHSYEGNRLASFFDVGTNVLLAWSMQIAVSGDFMRRASRRPFLGLMTVINFIVWIKLAIEVTAPTKAYMITFGKFGGFYFGEVALILNAFVVVGLFAASYKTIPRGARPMLHLTILMFLMGLFLATASNSQVSMRILAWHSIWHLDGAFGFISLWFFNHLRFNDAVLREPS